MSGNYLGYSAALVDSLPKCSFCDKEAQFDGATKMGPWANMCLTHFYSYGVGLGIGVGQRLILKQKEK